MVPLDGILHHGPDAEARYATILKCDLVGSTRTKRPLDLEGQLLFQRACERIFVTVAGRHAAHIERFEGDGALIAFGFPDPREDEAEAAVRMGLDLVQAIGEAKIVPGVRLQLRVGIASGVIAVLKRPSGPKEDCLAGMTIDLAERLRARAEPDQVLIADSTKRLAGGFFRYHDLGEASAKGLDDPVRAWQVVGESRVVSRFEAQRYDERPGAIIGRDAALAALAEMWRNALAGRGQAVCLIGDAGIGKSRLAWAAVDAALRDGATALKIDCTPSTGNTPLFPIGALLRHTANIVPTSTGAEKRASARESLQRLLPDEDPDRALAFLAPLFGLEGMPASDDASPVDLREKTIAAVARIVRNIASEQPLVVLCEDLHWVDDTTASLIARVCADIANLRVMVIVTARPSADPPSFDLLGATPIALSPLDPRMAADLVRHVAQGELLSDETVSRIVHRCEGVPLILEEVTRGTIEARGRPEDAIAMLGAVSDVPTTLQLVVQSRLNRWPQFAPIVQAASILGRDFSVPLLESMLPLPKSAIAGAIALLASEGLFTQSREGSGDRARFKHIMICEAVYNTLLGSDRQRMHSAVADILGREDSGTPPDVLAEHLRKSRRFVEAVRVRLAESVRTMSLGAYVEAEGHCSAALALIDDVPEPAERATLQFRLLIQLAVALTGRHGYSAAVVEDAYLRAQAVCGDQADAETLYPIMRGLATMNLIRGNLPTAYDLSLQGMRLADQSKRPEFQLDAMSVLCYTTIYTDRLHDCLGWIERLLEFYQRERGEFLTYPAAQDPATAALSLWPLAAWLTGDLQGSDAAVRDSLAHVDRLDSDFEKVVLNSWIGATRYMQRRYTEALQHAMTTVKIAERNSYQEWLVYGTLVGLLARAALNPDADAVAQGTAARMILAQRGVGLNAPYFAWGIARGHGRVGDREVAIGIVREAFARAQESGETRMNAELWILLAELEPDEDQAAALLSRASAVAEARGDITTALRAAATLALRFGGDPDARAALAILDGQGGYPVERGWVATSLAALKRTIGAGSGSTAVA